ncbi:MAG: hypothetical protein M3O67_08900 [Bacteroidota bacterium]|nr:hypothetical protein [Bacteroidota bacterium]
MAQINNILNELKDLGSVLANHTPQNVYEVPRGYFEALADQLINRIKAEATNTAADELNYLSPFISKLSKKNIYSIPAGYFDGLEERLMQEIREHADYETSKEELATLSPLINGLQKKSPYSVPQGYFENLVNEVSAKTKTKAKVISFGKKSTWLKYTAAAIIAGAISIAGFFYFKQGIKPSDPVKAWAKVEKKVQTVSDKDLEEFVQFSDAGLNENDIAKVQPQKTDEVNELLKDVSDTDLQEFLDQTSDTEEDGSSMN